MTRKWRKIWIRSFSGYSLSTAIICKPALVDSIADRINKRGVFFSRLLFFSIGLGGESMDVFSFKTWSIDVLGHSKYCFVLDRSELSSNWSPLIWLFHSFFLWLELYQTLSSVFSGTDVLRPPFVDFTILLIFINDLEFDLSDGVLGRIFQKNQWI